MGRTLSSALSWVLSLAIALTFATLVPLVAHSETYPSRPIRVIVPYSAGSGADITARQTMAKLSEFLGQNIIIENRPGTSAIVGTDAVAKAAPDGYTLLFGVTQHAINPTLQPKLPYDTLKDFVPVARVTDQPLYMAVNKALPGKNIAEVIEHIKAAPGKYNYASTGLGTSIHLAGAYFAWRAGVQMSHIPYTNASQTLVDLGSNEVQVLFYTYQPLVPQLQAGRIKILGSTGAARSAWAPDIPTMEEAGMPGFVMPAWHGVLAPAKTPPEIVGILEKALARVAQDPDYKKTIEPTGTDIYYAPSKEFGAFIESEIKRFGEILNRAGTKLP
ncbi:Bug family tripartite tricarboxylate transporter substrate binding protein [Rhodoplanes sp. Z2-YC6860]|uniref:Bug family tripartite tricarboxylate transporter substrate binding protein n=1 Tax=Rhodoplanes sp. Z2-YC6860 TaxID=674703 RepID=UPI00078DBF45|nr:tripartite tricarboxylate transporter substrate binding protein [Rhodoplanes sp. Z2-YC6860]AMN42079.1 TTT family tricarboxylate transporter, receptor protein [Rhodoplanes sp. Z2-YC6860]